MSRPRLCCCGCGSPLPPPDGYTTRYFLHGHYERWKQALIRVETGEESRSALPESVRRRHKWVPKGRGWVPTTDYKGDEHGGFLG